MGIASHNAIPAALASLVVATPFMSAQARPFAVVSTLDGKTVLPHHIRWRADPTVPAAAIERVEFLIDGRIRWVQTLPRFEVSDYTLPRKPGKPESCSIST